VSSPLPGFYTEELLDDEWDERHASKGFLDIIHHHIYPLLYQAWLKYRFSYNAIEAENERYWEIIFSVIGLSEEFRSNRRLAGKLLKYAGILCQQPKTQLGLKTILQDYFGDIEIDVMPCVPRKVSIVDHQKCKIGQKNHNLGIDTVIGQIVDDRSGKYILKIGPVDRMAFEKITNDETTRTFVRAVTKLFLVQPLEYEILLLLKSGAEKSISLGDSSCSVLGRNTWMINESNIESFSLTLT